MCSLQAFSWEMKKIVKRSSCLISPPPMVQQTLMDQGLLIIEASWSHLDTQCLAGLCWTSDEPNTETHAWEHKTFTRDRYPCPWRDLNPQSQQASGSRPMPWTAQPLGLVGGCLTRVNMTISCWGFYSYDASAMHYLVFHIYCACHLHITVIPWWLHCVYLRTER
jgi:hypothetical protein